jgi:ribosomal protein S18 acetylase RimI-like enzyme
LSNPGEINPVIVIIFLCIFSLIITPQKLVLYSSIYYKLDNPAWHSLQETHKNFSIGSDFFKRYQPAIVSFAAFHSNNKEVLKEMDNWMHSGESFFLIGEFNVLPSNYTIETILPCVQMVCTAAIKTNLTATIETLSEKDDDEIIALINKTLPGYYLRGTRLMGDYFGIRVNGELVAMTGERMRMSGLTEISAVVTHPEFTGRGYAQQLVAHTSNKNLAEGITPFLHTGYNNERAIRVYELLGYKTRKIINFTRIKRII